MKKIYKSLIAAILCLTFILSSVPATIASAIKADPIDGGEYEITVGTALCALRIAVGLVEADEETILWFDRDGDGVITVADALMLLRIAVGLA